MIHRAALAVALTLAVVTQAAGYYLPGTYPQEFFIGQQIQGEERGNSVFTVGSLLCGLSSAHVPTLVS